MNLSERIVASQLEGVGYTILNSGWPDFLAVSDDQIIAVEVKLEGHIVPKHQLAVHDALRRCGLDVRINFVPRAQLDKMCRCGHHKVYHVGGLGGCWTCQHGGAWPCGRYYGGV